MNPIWRRHLILVSASILSGACNSDVPEPATMESPALGLRVTVVRTATEPFRARYNLRLRVEWRDGCVASSDLFPDTGMASRRNVYLTRSGALSVIGQFDARVLSKETCTIHLVEFQHLEKDQTFLGAFDIDEGRQWRFIPSELRPEQSFEKR